MMLQRKTAIHYLALTMPLKACTLSVYRGVFTILLMVSSMVVSVLSAIDLNLLQASTSGKSRRMFMLVIHVGGISHVFPAAAVAQHQFAFCCVGVPV